MTVIVQGLESARLVAQGYRPNPSHTHVAVQGFRSPLFISQGYGLVASTFRTGSRTRHGSVAERGPAPARPVLHSVVPAFPSPADRPTPPNRPTVPE